MSSCRSPRDAGAQFADGDHRDGQLFWERVLKDRPLGLAGDENRRVGETATHGHGRSSVVSSATGPGQRRARRRPDGPRHRERDIHRDRSATGAVLQPGDRSRWLCARLATRARRGWLRNEKRPQHATSAYGGCRLQAVPPAERAAQRVILRAPPTDRSTRLPCLRSRAGCGWPPPWNGNARWRRSGRRIGRRAVPRRAVRRRSSRMPGRRRCRTAGRVEVVEEHRSSAALSRSRRRPTGIAATPYRSSASLTTVRNSEAPSRSAIHASTDGSGTGRISSETTLVSRTIITTA